MKALADAHAGQAVGCARARDLVHLTIADQEARKVGMPFDRVDYLLKSGTNGGAPVWELELSDGRSGRSGLLSIAADSGTVLRRQLDRSGRSHDRDYLDEPPPRVAGDAREEDDDRGPTVTLPRFIDRVGRHFQKRGRQLENFFTGR